jgi:hypothetical protein
MVDPIQGQEIGSAVIFFGSSVAWFVPSAHET